jgi:phage protein D
MGAGYSIQFNGAPDPELGNVASVEVYECIGESTTFRLRYVPDIVEGDLPLLKDDRLSAGSVITVFAQKGDSPTCLVKGTVYAQQIHLVHGDEGSTLEVVGADTSLAMDRENKSALWSDLTGSDAVTQILSTYSLTPDVESTTTAHAETKHVLVQRESDLAFVRRLARRNGFLFWIGCDDAGAVETGFFKRPPLDGESAAELIINLTDPEANLGSLDISWDVERPTSATATQLDLNSKSDITGDVAKSPLAPLGAKALADIASETRSFHVHAPVDDAGDLQARGEAGLIEADFFVRARGQTTAKALGSVLRAHTVVTLRGAGSRHSGKWFCSSVRHTIDDVEHRMEFELIRNGWEA